MDTVLATALIAAEPAEGLPRRRRRRRVPEPDRVRDRHQDHRQPVRQRRHRRRHRHGRHRAVGHGRRAALPVARAWSTAPRSGASCGSSPRPPRWRPSSSSRRAGRSLCRCCSASSSTRVASLAFGGITVAELRDVTRPVRLRPSGQAQPGAIRRCGTRRRDRRRSARRREPMPSSTRALECRAALHVWPSRTLLKYGARASRLGRPHPCCAVSARPSGSVQPRLTLALALAGLLPPYTASSLRVCCSCGPAA